MINNQKRLKDLDKIKIMKMRQKILMSNNCKIIIILMMNTNIKTIILKSIIKYKIIKTLSKMKKMKKMNQRVIIIINKIKTKIKIKDKINQYIGNILNKLNLPILQVQ